MAFLASREPPALYSVPDPSTVLPAFSPHLFSIFSFVALHAGHVLIRLSHLLLSPFYASPVPPSYSWFVHLRTKLDSLRPPFFFGFSPYWTMCRGDLDLAPTRSVGVWFPDPCGLGVFFFFFFFFFSFSFFFVFFSKVPIFIISTTTFPFPHILAKYCPVLVFFVKELFHVQKSLLTPFSRHHIDTSFLASELETAGGEVFFFFPTPFVLCIFAIFVFSLGLKFCAETPFLCITLSKRFSCLIFVCFIEHDFSSLPPFPIRELYPTVPILFWHTDGSIFRSPLHWRANGRGASLHWWLDFLKILYQLR